MKHISLFSGQGGFDLAADWLGWDNIAHCEIDDFCKQILKYYWPKAISYHDITKTDFTIHRNRVDIVTGGFPCQPYSIAGKQKGTADERHLWPEMLRAIREIKPPFVVGENVPGIISWNGGLVFEQVQVDLENEGYEVQPYVLPAAGIQAPHGRHRVWFVAYSNSNDAERKRYGQTGCKTCEMQTFQKEWERFRAKPKRIIEKRNATHTNNQHGRPEPQIRMCSPRPWSKPYRCNKTSIGRTGWDNFPTQSPLLTGNDGFSDRLDGITFLEWKKKSGKSAGNAIVPQVALQIFKAIEQFNKLK